MNKPRNHHYVSQTHLKKFFNNEYKEIYVYDKLLDNHYIKGTTRTLFSEKDLNTRFENNAKDFSSIESDLNENFENEFSDNFAIVKNLIDTKNFTVKENAALINFAKYGIIGELRTPRHKKAIDDTLIDAINDIIPHCVPELQKEIDEMLSFKKHVKYSNAIDYSEIAERILESMGNLGFLIIIPKEASDFFVIPDCSSITIRKKINTYFNPDIKEIAFIGLPLSSKMYIHFYSEKLFKDRIPLSEIKYGNTDLIDKINKTSIDFSKSKIACECQEYLINFIKRIKKLT